jgi:aryl-alcohol dehydrogenase-like predicted oxidoreductase
MPGFRFKGTLAQMNLYYILSHTSAYFLLFLCSPVLLLLCLLNSVSFNPVKGKNNMAKSLSNPLPRRLLGRTGEKLSIIGMGGIVVMDEEEGHANKVVREAIEAGVNYFDVAPTYGNAEEKLGPALEPFRQEVFLACKTMEREKKAAENELNTSLKTLRTDHLDLYQMHSLETREDIDRAFGPNGAIETFVRAKKEGKTRFLGFSAHSVEAALAAMDLFDFDTVLFQINYVCYFKGNYGPQVVEKARQKGMGILALKAGARTVVKKGEEPPYKKCWYQPLEKEEEIRRAFAFALSQPITAALTPGEEKFFRLALEAASSFVWLKESEMMELKKEAQGIEPLFKYPAWPV